MCPMVSQLFSAQQAAVKLVSCRAAAGKLLGSCVQQLLSCFPASPWGCPASPRASGWPAAASPPPTISLHIFSNRQLLEKWENIKFSLFKGSGQWDEWGSTIMPINGYWYGTVTVGILLYTLPETSSFNLRISIDAQEKHFRLLQINEAKLCKQDSISYNPQCS